MHFTMNVPGLEGFNVMKTETIGSTYYIHVEKERKAHRCPACGAHDS
ncbi:hypothetical protein [Salibacterium qingdaonense]|uniref:Zinc-finger of transposase IS204/IS1001/IS1096/IS1165 n=1 Tax=Salibacterium qingdaonense TaxID=266892 RepID=A0A1I4NHK8_9BACI|nr:hypothetical protein SAMN04488054_1183 [Salibacterium qingdaonense]